MHITPNNLVDTFIHSSQTASLQVEEELKLSSVCVSMVCIQVMSIKCMSVYAYVFFCIPTHMTKVPGATATACDNAPCLIYGCLAPGSTNQ